MNASSSTLPADDFSGAVAPSPSAAPEAEARAGALDRLSWASRIGLTITFLFSAFLVLQTPLNHDVACTLVYAKRLLGGAHLYVDFVDNNPPLAFFLTVPIELLAQITGWPEAGAVAVVALGLTALGTWLVYRVLRTALHDEPLIVATLLSTLLALLLAPVRDLGQREHLMLLLFMPYAYWCAVSATGPRSLRPSMRVTIGVLACIGLSIKPHFFLAYLTLLAYIVVSRRSLRPAFAAEHVLIPAGALLYLLAALVLTPEYTRDMVPLALAHYGAYGAPLQLILAEWGFLFVVSSSIILAVAGPWLTGDRAWGGVVRALSLASLAFLVVYLIQLRGFTYHFLPARALNFPAMVIAIVGFVRNMTRRSAPAGGTARPSTGALLQLAGRAAALAFAAIPAGFIVYFVAVGHLVDVGNARDGIRSPLAEPLIDIVHEHAAGKPIFVLSSSVFPAFPLVNLSGATWPYRYNCLWLLPAHYGDDTRFSRAVYRTPDRQSTSERAFFDDVIQDLVKTPPALLIVDRHRFKQAFGGIYFDFVEYYEQSPEFARLFQHYRLIAQRSGFDVFEYAPPVAQAASR